jgi:hypothetical protein
MIKVSSATIPADKSSAVSSGRTDLRVEDGPNGVTRGAAFIRLSRHSSVPQLKVRDLRLASNILLVPKALSEYTINNT